MVGVDRQRGLVVDLVGDAFGVAQPPAPQHLDGTRQQFGHQAAFAHAGVAFSDSDFFVADYAGHFRVNFATSAAILTEAFERAGQALRPVIRGSLFRSSVCLLSLLVLGGNQ